MNAYFIQYVLTTKVNQKIKKFKKMKNNQLI